MIIYSVEHTEKKEKPHGARWNSGKLRTLRGEVEWGEGEGCILLYRGGRPPGSSNDAAGPAPAPRQLAPAAPGSR